MKIKKTLCLICCAALVFTLAGCKNNKSTVAPVDSDSDGTGAATTVVTTVTQTGVLGEEAEMKDVQINVNKIYRSEFYGSQDGVLSNVMFFDVTITNNSDTEINTNMLTSFEFIVNGEIHNSATLLAINSVQKQFGNDVNLFAESLKPGETQTGIIPAELPRNFDEAEINFLPLGGRKGGGDTSNILVFKFSDRDLEFIKTPDNDSGE